MIGEAELRRLAHLTCNADAVTFEAAWQTAAALLRRIAECPGLPPDPQETDRP